MPRGVPNAKIEDPANAAVVDKVVRSREELDADTYTAEFLKRNRPNLAGFEQKLAYYGEHAGWKRHWANDEANRIQSLLDRGWRLVRRAEVGMSDSVGHGNTDIGDRVSVATNGGEGPMRVILMEIPQKLFDMQMDAQLDPVRKSEEAIRGGAFGLTETANVYQPKGIENRIETKH